MWFIMQKDILKVFGKNLKNNRKNIGYTQEQFAEMVNMTPTYISLIENGKGNIKLRDIELFANLLEVDYVKFFEN